MVRLRIYYERSNMKPKPATLLDIFLDQYLMYAHKVFLLWQMYIRILVTSAKTNTQNASE